MKDESVAVDIYVEDNGHIVLKTKEETLPIEVVQRILDELITGVVHVCGDEKLKERMISMHKEMKVWKFLAFSSLFIILILVLKLKGAL